MRLLYQSHVYVIASTLLHIVILVIAVFGSFRLSQEADAFQATVHFETPETQKTRIEQVQAEKTPSTPRVTTSNPQVNTLSSKNLDDILKERRIKVSADDQVADKIERKKSDLLGYLRATRNTKREETETTDTPRESVEPQKAPEPSPAQTEQSKQSQETATSQQTVQQTPEPSQVDEQVTEDSPSVPPARRIWQRKLDIRDYRNVLNKLVSRNWTLPPGKIKDFQIIYDVTIDKNGNVVQMDLQKSSGLPGIDASAERAIRVSAPFPELPESLGPDETQYKATFRFTPKHVSN